MERYSEENSKKAIRTYFFFWKKKKGSERKSKALKTPLKKVEHLRNKKI